jgi:hypothetical protein
MPGPGIGADMAKPPSERRRDTGQLVAAVENLSKSFDRFREEQTAETRQLREEFIKFQGCIQQDRKDIDKLDATVNGNGKTGLKEDVSNLSLRCDGIDERYDGLTVRVNGWSAVNSLGVVGAAMLALLLK